MPGVKRAKRSVFYHGTSGKNLRRILKTGLLPAGTKGLDLVYDYKPYPGSRDESTYGGVYLTDDVSVAADYAWKTSGYEITDDGVLLIACTVETRTENTYIDEDFLHYILEIATIDIASRLWHSYLVKGVREIFSKNKRYNENRGHYLPRSSYQDVVDAVAGESFQRESMAFLTKAGVPDFRKVDVVAPLIRLWIYHLLDSEYDGAPEEPGVKKPRALVSTRAPLKVALEKVEKSLRIKTDFRGESRIRYPYPITYRGKNRILWIVRARYPNADNEDYKAVVDIPYQSAGGYKAAIQSLIKEYGEGYDVIPFSRRGGDMSDLTKRVAASFVGSESVRFAAMDASTFLYRRLEKNRTVLKAWRSAMRASSPTPLYKKMRTFLYPSSNLGAFKQDVAELGLEGTTKEQWRKMYEHIDRMVPEFWKLTQRHKDLDPSVRSKLTALLKGNALTQVVELMDSLAPAKMAATSVKSDTRKFRDGLWREIRRLTSPEPVRLDDVLPGLREHLPPHLFRLVSPSQLDWIDPVFEELSRRSMDGEMDLFSLAMDVDSLRFEEPLDPEEEFSSIMEAVERQLLEFVGVVTAATKRAHAWQDTRVVVSPDLNTDSIFNRRADGKDLIGTFHINVGKEATMTVFVKGSSTVYEVEDVLEGGDQDNFSSPQEQSDYFSLVKELRSPGSTSKGKWITLWTARPVKDRRLFDGGRQLPVNLFLTTDADRAAGIARDMGGRDLYQVVVNTRDLVETLKAGRIRDFQTIAPAALKAITRTSA